MKSRAHVKGHPIHPIVVGFPISFFVAAMVTDIVGLINDRTIYPMATYLAAGGIVMGLVAAVPGIIDYNYTVPPNSSGKKRALKHGLLNTGVILLFITALIYRQWSSTPDLLVILALEMVAGVCLFFAGWMGGTLVYRNQIGVNPRYAGAGKWKEVYLNAVTDGYYPVDGAKELQVNQMMLLHVSGERIVLAKTEKGYAAFEDRCPHRGGSLAGGAMICNTVQCPWHGSQFDVLTGSAKEGPAKESIKIYAIKEENGQVFLKK